MKELGNGGLEAAISDSLVVMEFIRNNGNKDFSMIELPDFKVENYGLVVSQDDTATLELLNKTLARVRANPMASATVSTFNTLATPWPLAPRLRYPIRRMHTT